MKTIAVIAATPGELSALIDAFHARRHPAKLPWDIFLVKEGQITLLFVVSGIGTANASAATAVVAQLFSPDLLISTGCAGAYDGSGLEIGDLALATTDTFADEGILVPAGWRSLDFLGIPLLEQNGTRLFNEFPLSRRENAQALRLAGDLDISLATGRFLTVATCSGTALRGTELRNRFEGLCENMEGAAVALVAARYGIDCLEVRGISNRVEDRDISRWDIERATTAAQWFLEQFLREH